MKDNGVQVVGLRVRQPPRIDSFVNLWISNPMCELEQVQSPHSNLEWGACCITLFQVPIWMTVFTFCRHMLHTLLSLSFVICKMGVTIVADLKDCCEIT